MTEFWKSLGLDTLLIAIAIFTGGVIPIFKHWHRLPILLSLGAGIMLGSAFFHLMPEAFEILGKSTGTYVLLGFLFLYFIEKFITVHICEVLDCEVHHLGITAFIGIAIHTLSNGIALGSGLLAPVPGLGIAVFLAVLAHKAPEAFSLTSVLLHSGIRRSQIILVHVVTLSMIPLGAILAYFVVSPGNTPLIGKALAFSSGTFLHISLSDLLPEVHKHSQHKYAAFVFFLLGLALMAFLATHVAHQ